MRNIISSLNGKDLLHSVEALAPTNAKLNKVMETTELEFVNCGFSIESTNALIHFLSQNKKVDRLVFQECTLGLARISD
jgi:hypothetical protein